MIDAHEREIRGYLELDCDSTFRKSRLETPQRLLDDFGSRYWFECIGLADVGDARIREQVVDQAAEVIRLLNQEIRILPR